MDFHLFCYMFFRSRSAQPLLVPWKLSAMTHCRQWLLSTTVQDVEAAMDDAAVSSRALQS
jgi:hypothetical protein